MYNKMTAASMLLLASLSVSQTGIAVEITQGAMLANSCAACHGTNGKSPGAIPAINGKPESFIIESMKAFQSGARPSTVMGRHANGYTEEEIKLIAEFFSRQQ